MKVKLEFDEFNDNCKMALNGQKYFNCLWEIYKYLHNLEKYDEQVSIEKVNERFLEILEDKNVDLFEIE